MNDQYQELYTSFRWWVPQRFNIAEACTRRWTATSADGRRIALYAEDPQGNREVWTYARLQEYANRLANGMRRIGVQRGDRVAIAMGQRPETVVAFMAVLQMGAIALPLSPDAGSDALEFRLRHSEARLAIADETSIDVLGALMDRCPMLRQLIGINTQDDVSLPWRTLIARQESAFDPVVTHAADPAILLYTAGGGTPRGALLPHAALIGHLPGFVASQNWFPDTTDVFWTPAPWCSPAGLLNALLPALYFGQPIVGARGAATPEQAFGVLERYQVTNVYLPPATLRAMRQSVPAPASRYQLVLRAIASAGDGLDEATVAWAREALQITVNEVFGQIESNYILGNSHEKWPARPGSIGRPYPGHQVAVLDADGSPVAPGEVGEIAINRYDLHGHADPVMFLGYWRDEEATEARFRGSWSRTGDLARVDADGYYWYCGRIDDVFEAAGHQIGPGEIEQCLAQHPAVLRAAVVPVPDSERGNRIKAFVMRQRDAAPDDAALAAGLRELARARLAPYEQPDEIEFVSELPMSPTGRVQRQVLRQREVELARARSTDPAAPVHPR